MLAPPSRRFLVITGGSLATCCLVVAGLTLWNDHQDALHMQRMFGGERGRPERAADATVFVQDTHGRHALARGAKVATGAKVLLSLEPAGHRFVAAALVDQGGVKPLYIGPAQPGPLPQAFLWTGSGVARLIVDYADAPIAKNRFVRRLTEAGPAPRGTERVELQISR